MTVARHNLIRALVNHRLAKEKYIRLILGSSNTAPFSGWTEEHFTQVPCREMHCATSLPLAYYDDM